MAAAFYKMSGSGNDFVFFDARDGAPPGTDTPEAIQRLCARGTGVGADGVVFLEPAQDAAFRMRYHNADGSRAEMCGNAALCSCRLAVELGIVTPGSEFDFVTDSGVIRGRVHEQRERPEIDLGPVTEVRVSDARVQLVSGERRAGYALAGVPHVVILCADLGTADVAGRGSSIRRDPAFPAGANVNFVSPAGAGGWSYRTFERGVESETLACGTGAVATAVLLTDWGDATGDVRLKTRSGEELKVRLRRDGSRWLPSLEGPARIVFEGQLREG